MLAPEDVPPTSNTLLIHTAKTTPRMSLTPEEISEAIRIFSKSQVMEYIQLGFQTFFLYYWLTTIATEVNLMWPRRWRWGKALFLINRYLPIMHHVTNILTGFRGYIVLDPKVHPNCILF
ncbi:hypothetical protein DFP72DRAFT_922707 [Ephemerocybe angulata]|uniref:DUF6533 domain-containing protein n=1 Tax=Ephemerocybe angulata TaxID=980116 RepID=A0A8H6HIX7_9AGAR|nr:hypothetical protein DFP72DRAFT_922707 [Tulosesus angulatus]